MQIVTFEQFQQSRKAMHLSDYNAMYKEDIEDCELIFVYMGGARIEVMGNGSFYLLLEKSEYISTDLLELEKRLYEYCDGEYLASSEEVLRDYEFMEQKVDLLNALLSFEQAAVAINGAWYGLANDLIQKDYPFSESFDEIVFKITRWVNTSREVLND